MPSLMKQVGEQHGLQFGETFIVEDTTWRGGSKQFTFTEEGVRSADNTIDYSMTVRLVRGTVTVKKPDYRPTQGKMYFCVSALGDITGKNYHPSNIYDRINLKIGNCFRTREEVTPEIVQKYVNFYSSDERIDI